MGIIWISSDMCSMTIVCNETYSTHAYKKKYPACFLKCYITDYIKRMSFYLVQAVTVAIAFYECQ
jgi:hypothetical protein